MALELLPHGAMKAAGASLLRSLTASDLVIERSPNDSACIVSPCHERAAEWLCAIAIGGTWVGRELEVEVRDVDEVLARSIEAGFTVALRFEGQPRIMSGSRLALRIE